MFKKKFLNSCFTLLGLSLSFNAFAVNFDEETSVFCATKAGTDWHWLTDDSGNQVKAQGHWGTRIIGCSGHSQEETYRFELRDFNTEYNALKAKCEKKHGTGYVPQPANYSNSKWSRFAERKPYENENGYVDGKSYAVGDGYQSTWWRFLDFSYSC